MTDLAGMHPRIFYPPEMERPSRRYPLRNLAAEAAASLEALGIEAGRQAGRQAELITPEVEYQPMEIKPENLSTKTTKGPKNVKSSRPRLPAWWQEATPAVRRAYLEDF